MRVLSLLVSLSGIIGSSLAEDNAHTSRSGACHNPMVRCFERNHDAAVKYCSNFPVSTSVARQTVTITVTRGIADAGTITTDTTSPSSLPTNTKQEAYCPTSAPYPCAKCHKPHRQRLACSCIGVPQRTVTTQVTETKTVIVTISSSSSTDSSSASATIITTSSTASSTSTSGSSTTTSSPSSSTSSSTSSTADPVFTDFSYQGIILGHHNVHRSNHSAPDLIWSPSLAATALSLAQTCMYRHDTSAGGGGYGQNIGAGFSPTDMGLLITEGYYNGEVNNYPQYGADNIDLSNFASWGRFSQVVWASTSQIGCATYDCSGRAGGLQDTSPGVPPWFTVCNYSPAGNFVGEWSQVRAPLGRPSVFANYGCPTSATCG